MVTFTLPLQVGKGSSKHRFEEVQVIRMLVELDES